MIAGFDNGVVTDDTWDCFTETENDPLPSSKVYGVSSYDAS